jgi:hypothetical protein
MGQMSTFVEQKMMAREHFSSYLCSGKRKNIG